MSTTTPSYLVVGEAVADRVRSTDGRVTTHPGGSPMNVAYGLGRLACAATLVTQLGQDDHGRIIRSHLMRAGVDVVNAGRADEATATATAVLDDTGAARYSFDISWSLPARASMPRPTHVHMGSIAAYLTPGADVVEQMVSDLRATATVSFDPNVRPALLGSRAGVAERTERLVFSRTS